VTGPEFGKEGIEVVARLSSGGMGEVLLARRVGAHGFEKLIAVKTIRADLVHAENVRRMFLDEARLVARLSHPCVAHVYDFGELDGALYLAMEYVPGIGLNRIIRKWARPLPPLVAAKIAAQVCEGLHAAHELRDKDGRLLGVVHRDVTPQNLILGFDGRTRILDFGIALMRNREAPETEFGVVKGKPSYMAPEQIRHNVVDRRTDIYSVSVVLHELLTGRRLFPDDSILATAKAIERGKIDPPGRTIRDIPPALDEIVMKGLAKELDDRFRDAREMACALDEVVRTNKGQQLEEFVDVELKAERERHWARLRNLLEGKPVRSDSSEDEAPTIITKSTRLGPRGEDAATMFAKLKSSNDLTIAVRDEPGGWGPIEARPARGPPPTKPPSNRSSINSVLKVSLFVFVLIGLMLLAALFARTLK
jgi:serine/threonine-protein kinase